MDFILGKSEMESLSCELENAKLAIEPSEERNSFSRAQLEECICEALERIENAQRILQR